MTTLLHFSQLWKCRSIYSMCGIHGGIRTSPEIFRLISWYFHGSFSFKLINPSPWLSRKWNWHRIRESCAKQHINHADEPQKDDLTLVIIKSGMFTPVDHVYFGGGLQKSLLPTYFPFFLEVLHQILHGLFVPLNGITGLQARHMSLWYFSTPTLVCLVAKLWVWEKVKESGWEKGEWDAEIWIANPSCTIWAENALVVESRGAELNSLQGPSAPREINLILWFD